VAQELSVHFPVPRSGLPPLSTQHPLQDVIGW
jgi:hypothetical protein